MDNQEARKRAVVICNPTAGRNKNKQDIWDVVDDLFSSGYDVEIYFTQKAGDAYRFTWQYGKKSDLLVSCGGDGTLNEVVHGIIAYGIDVPLSHLPLGTANDMAKTLHLPDTMLETAALRARKEPIRMDAGIMNDRNVFTYVAAFGAFTGVSYQTSQSLKNKLGYNAYLLTGIRALQDIRPYEATITTDTSTYTGRFVYGSMSNSITIGGGIIHLKKEQMSLLDGKFELLLIRFPETAAEWLHAITSIAKGQFDGQQVILESTSQAYFSFDEPVSWALDGESAGDFKCVETEVRQHAYQIYGDVEEVGQEAHAMQSGRMLASNPA